MQFKKMTPIFSVKNINETVNFYQNILEFELHVVVNPDTKSIDNSLLNLELEEYSYAMLSKDSVYVMFLEKNDFNKTIPTLHKSEIKASILFYIEVDQIDTLYKRLEASSVTIVKELTTSWYGMREFFIQDCNGYILAFSEQV